MVSKNRKVFDYEDRQAIFDIEMFKMMFKYKAKNSGEKITNYEQMLADELSLSRDAIHNWRNDLNGPGDMETIKKLAAYWNMDVCGLLKENEEMKATMPTINDTQLAAVGRINEKVITFLRGFLNSHSDSIELVYNGSLLKLYDDIESQFEMEYMYLPKDVFDRFEDYILSLVDLINYEIKEDEAPDTEYELYLEKLIEYRQIIDELNRL